MKKLFYTTLILATIAHQPLHAQDSKETNKAVYWKTENFDFEPGKEGKASELEVLLWNYLKVEPAKSKPAPEKFSKPFTETITTYSPLRPKSQRKRKQYQTEESELAVTPVSTGKSDKKFEVTKTQKKSRFVRTVWVPTPSNNTLVTTTTTTSREFAQPTALTEAEKLKDQRGQLSVVPLAEGIRLHGKQSNVDRAAWLLASRIDLPRSQLQMDMWALQINADASDFEGTQDRLQTIDLGLRLTRELSREFFLVVFDRMVRNIQKECGEPGSIRTELEGLKPASGFLTLFDFIKYFGVCPRPCLLKQLKDEGFRNFWLQTLDRRIRGLEAELKNAKLDLPCKDRQALEELQKLLLIMKRRAEGPFFLARTKDFYTTPLEAPGGGEVAFSPEEVCIDKAKPVRLTPGQESLANYLKVANTGSGGPFELRRCMNKCDMDLRTAVQAVSSDISFLLTEPFSEWVEEVASETNQLNMVGYHRIWVESGNSATSNVSATNYRRYEPLLKEDGKPTAIDNDRTVAVGVVAAAVNSTDIKDIFLNQKFQDALFRDPKPTYSDVAPGLNLKLEPWVSSATQTQLHVELDFAADDEVTEADKAAIADGLRPLSLVKKSELTTDVAIPSFEIFELSTRWMQTTREGGPAWACPVLRHIPIVGPYLFEGPVRPKTINQGVMIFCQATVIPRSVDILPPKEHLP